MSSRQLLILLIPVLSANNSGLLSHGFLNPPALQSRLKSPSRRASWLSSSSIKEDSVNDIKSIFSAAESKSKNIDYERRARSLARRGRLAQWRAAVAQVEDEDRISQDSYFLIAAFLPAVFAFLLWGKISIGLSVFLSSFGVVNSAEGIVFTDNLLRPTIIGVVVPVISIALATLVSTTVNVLRQRQVDLRAFINEEAGELRFLRRAIFGMYGTRQHAGRRARALVLLRGYVEQLMTECDDGAVGRLEEMQLSGGIADNELDRFAAMLHGVDGAAASRQGSVEAAEELIRSLNSHRSKRVALLLTDFPVLHWDILAGLNVSILIAFLLTSNQPTLQYLSSIQLRFLFATIVAVCSGTATLCWDLDNPFSGSFSIAGASTQLADMRVCLREDIREALVESDEIPSDTRKFFRSQFGGPSVSASRELSEEDEELDPSSRYGLLPTLYWHLLTGPAGAYVRMFGDAAAWLTTIVGRKLQTIILHRGRRVRLIIKRWWRSFEFESA
ncbi:DUF4239 domain-containing protein [Skeletonema marinoi]|uniref:DUF4239 domain-containing protein n=1 Tax=Skeletonema marinoi TaxID=267567 RepID=A0AAD9D536_9STRA|nr:DUF4239 domain-containing protein [Skeletonema marinoi]